MSQRRFTVILLPLQKGGYQVFFPYYPNCITSGETVEEALRNAREALGLHLEVEIEQGEEIPDFVHVPYVIVGEVVVAIPDRKSVTSTRLGE